jgi:hypothetical protein
LSAIRTLQRATTPQKWLAGLGIRAYVARGSQGRTLSRRVSRGGPLTEQTYDVILRLDATQPAAVVNAMTTQWFGRCLRTRKHERGREVVRFYRKYMIDGVGALRAESSLTGNQKVHVPSRTGASPVPTVRARAAGKRTQRASLAGDK